MNQAGNIAKVGVVAGAPTAMALPGLHSTWELLKNGGKTGVEVTAEDP